MWATDFSNGMAKAYFSANKDFMKNFKQKFLVHFDKQLYKINT
jgi:DNA-binding transcriptional regulator GbsR (MarR family)